MIPHTLDKPMLQLCSGQTLCIDSTQTSTNLCVITDRNPGVDWALYKRNGQTLIATPVQVTLPPYVPMHSFTCQDQVTQLQSNISLLNSNMLVSGQYVLVAKDSYGTRNVTLNISIAGMNVLQSIFFNGYHQHLPGSLLPPLPTHHPHNVSIRLRPDTHGAISPTISLAFCS